MRFRTTFALLLLLPALAGCSSRAPDPQATATMTSSSQTILTFQPPPPTTDTLYLLDAPHLTAQTPTATQDKATPVEGSSDYFVRAMQTGTADPLAFWKAPRHGLKVLEGNATVYVDVQGTVTNPSSATGGCFWAPMLRADDASGSFSSVGGCGTEPDAVIAPGVHVLHFHFDPIDISDIAGDTVGMTLEFTGDAAPGATVRVLGGSAEHPSQLAIQGIALPLDTQTLLV